MVKCNSETGFRTLMRSLGGITTKEEFLGTGMFGALAGVLVTP